MKPILSIAALIAVCAMFATVSCNKISKKGTLTTTTTNPQAWNVISTVGFGTDLIYSDLSIAIDTGGTPYVVYSDSANGGKATVMKYNGSNWVTVGKAGFSAAMVFLTPTAIAIAKNGTPYVVYQDSANGGAATVMKYNGSSWVTVGNPGFSSVQVNDPSIAIDGNGTPYVVYEGGSIIYGQIIVMEYNGSSWVTLGNAGFPGIEPTIAIDNSDIPYVAYQDSANGLRATVMKYMDTGWVAIGSVGFTDSLAVGPSIVIDGSGTPYVAYQAGINGPATVMKYNGSSWVTLGQAGFSAGYAVGPLIAIDANSTPYVAYFDGANAGTTVMKYNGSSWVTVGNTNFTFFKYLGIQYDEVFTVSSTPISIAINKNGTPYVACGLTNTSSGNITSGKVTVMKYGN